MGSSMPVSIARARPKPLLKGKRVLITPHVKPDKGAIASSVVAVQGQVVDEGQLQMTMQNATHAGKGCDVSTNPCKSKDGGTHRSYPFEKTR
ncbi:hypothetical protein VNO77_41600 [Canavalia gladiata]|uniref:Uncharacterized protein n=1 Tax=Canavalia gladiata TaxID=3824 RepID=A0AAN9JZ83_CANGL